MARFWIYSFMCGCGAIFGTLTWARMAPDNVIRQAFDPAFAYGIPALFAMMFVFPAWGYFRHWQAARGAGPICPHCYGPLHAEQDGRYGVYRKCMKCERNINERYYD